MLDHILNETNVNVNSSASLREFVDSAHNQFRPYFENKSHDGELNIYKTGFKLEHMLISCEYQNRPCTWRDFAWYHDYKYGNCYRFNGNDTLIELRSSPSPSPLLLNGGGKLRNSTRPGAKNGLRLELFVGDPLTQQRYSYSSGIYLIVHNQSIVPVADETGIELATGLQTNVAVTRSFIRKLSRPYSNCIEELNEESGRICLLYTSRRG